MRCASIHTPFFFSCPTQRKGEEDDDEDDDEDEDEDEDEDACRQLQTLEAWALHARAGVCISAP